jgi:hypothetical protein
VSDFQFLIPKFPLPLVPLPVQSLGAFVIVILQQYFASMSWLIFILSLVGLINAALSDTMPAPFYRELYLSDPIMTGNDVLIAQTLLQRDAAVSDSFVASGNFEDDSKTAVGNFQDAHSLPSTGILDSASAQLLLDLHSDDQYTDSGFTAASMGYLYKFHILVHTNRSVETYSTLFDKDNNVLLKFRTRTHGHRADGTDTPWPDFGNGDFGLTQFATSGTLLKEALFLISLGLNLCYTRILESSLENR